MNSSLNLSNTYKTKYNECLIEIFTNRGSVLLKNAIKQNYFLFKENGIIPGKYIFTYFDSGRLTQNKYKQLFITTPSYVKLDMFHPKGHKSRLSHAQLLCIYVAINTNQSFLNNSHPHFSVTRFFSLNLRYCVSNTVLCFI